MRILVKVIYVSSRENGHNRGKIGSKKRKTPKRITRMDQVKKSSRMTYHGECNRQRKGMDEDIVCWPRLPEQQDL